MPLATDINALCVPVHCNIECGHNDSHRARHVSNRSDIYKVAKVVHRNWSDSYFTQSDTLPSILSDSYCTQPDTLPSILPEFC